MTIKQSLSPFMIPQYLDAIFWDFDGVLINSNSIREMGFEKVLSDYPKEKVEALLQFHKANGGLSRYVKFRHFFENILGEKPTAEKLFQLSSSFSEIMQKALNNHALLNLETLEFVKTNHLQYPMYIVSGSDQEELRRLCQQMNIDVYFKSIHGSPTPKVELVSQLIKINYLNASKCVLIGDSINDYEAAHANNIMFYAYNNSDLVKYSNCKFDFMK